jgi:hypothetical protein
MTDRELLEKAAKAAGQERSAAGDLWSNARGALWNPLTDDGDALRLMVVCAIDVCIVQKTEGLFVAASNYETGEFAHEPYVPKSFEPYRRAIVRAAAAIGEAA